jgi:hypothetical protein
MADNGVIIGAPIVIVVARAIVKPDTVIRWHRAGFRAYWRWKSSPRVGRPKVPLEVRQLIREMSLANPLRGAPRIHGELLKLGIEVGQTSLAKYMARWRRPPSQGWKTFLRNHADGIAAIDLFVVPTIFVSASVWLVDPAARSTPDLMAGGHGASDRRVARSSAHRGVRLGAGSPLPDPGSGSGLRRGVHPTCSHHGHPRSTNIAAIAMAKWICRTVDRVNPEGVH